MGATEYARGVTSAATGTETLLANISTPTNQFWIVSFDASRLADGEQVELKVLIGIPSAQFQNTVLIETFTAPFSTGPHIQTPPILAPVSILVALKQISGTTRTFAWIVHNF